MTPEIALVSIIGLLVLGYVLSTAIQHLWSKETEMLSPVEVIDKELKRLHIEMDMYTNGTQDSEAYKSLILEVGRLNQALIDLEMENTKGFNAVQLNESRSSNALSN